MQIRIRGEEKKIPKIEVSFSCTIKQSHGFHKNHDIDTNI